MVVPENRRQETGIRKKVVDIQRIIITGTVFLIPDSCFLRSAQARDLGIHGITYPIEESDPIQAIQKKLKVMEDNGELERRNLELQKKARTSVERPKPVEGITRAIKRRVFYYDPTYIVQTDIFDHQGQAFAKKGSRINPLETVSLSTNLIFFDGDNEEQLKWVQDKLITNTKIKSLRLILVRGAPLKLAEELEVPVYFDQNGILTKKLGIQHVPAVVSQERLRLKIEEIKLPPSRELYVEGDE